MPTIDIVLSAYVGGSTGKSLFTHMRTAYRLDPNSSFYNHQPRVVLVVDASYGSVLFDTMCTLFGRDIANPDTELIETCYYFMTSINDTTFIAVRPNNRLTLSPDDFFKLFREVAKHYPRAFLRHHRLPSIDHIICETNLPHESVATSGLIQKILDLWENPKIHLWSTWNTTALLAQVEYQELIRLYTNISRLGVQWSHVHNPFSTTAGQPENRISEAMKMCFELGLTRSTNPSELLLSCYDPAFARALDREASNEDIWKAAYQRYIDQGKRPINILPIYARSDYWSRVSLTKYFYAGSNGISVHTIQEPQELPSLVNKLSENLYSDLFFKYFEQIQSNKIEL